MYVYVHEVRLVKSSFKIFEMEIWTEKEGVALISVVLFIVHYIDHVVLYMA